MWRNTGYAGNNHRLSLTRWNDLPRLHRVNLYRRKDRVNGPNPLDFHCCLHTRFPFKSPDFLFSLFCSFFYSACYHRALQNKCAQIIVNYRRLALGWVHTCNGTWGNCNVKKKKKDRIDNVNACTFEKNCFSNNCLFVANRFFTLCLWDHAQSEQMWVLRSFVLRPVQTTRSKIVRRNKKDFNTTRKYQRRCKFRRETSSLHFSVSRCEW